MNRFYKNAGRSCLYRGLPVLTVLLCSGVAFPATFEVTNGNSSLAGSFRWAITDVNAQVSGGGALLVNDWVQTGRYVAGLDAPQDQSRPSSP